MYGDDSCNEKAACPSEPQAYALHASQYTAHVPCMSRPAGTARADATYLMQGCTLLTLPGLQCILPQAPSDTLLQSAPDLGCCRCSTAFMPRIVDLSLPPVQARHSCVPQLSCETKRSEREEFGCWQASTIGSKANCQH